MRHNTKAAHQFSANTTQSVRSTIVCDAKLELCIFREMEMTTKVRLNCL